MTLVAINFVEHLEVWRFLHVVVTSPTHTNVSVYLVSYYIADDSSIELMEV